MVEDLQVEAGEGFEGRRGVGEVEVGSRAEDVVSEVQVVVGSVEVVVAEAGVRRLGTAEVEEDLAGLVEVEDDWCSRTSIPSSALGVLRSCPSPLHTELCIVMVRLSCSTPA